MQDEEVAGQVQNTIVTEDSISTVISAITEFMKVVYFSGFALTVLGPLLILCLPIYRAVATSWNGS